MNNNRRKAINAIIDKLESLKDELETIQDEEQEYFDNMPESLQESERGELSEESIENLGIVIDSIADAISAAQDATM